MNSMQFEFNAVVDHLYHQGRPALNKEGSCSYRAEDGTSCAVGCRIPDSMYSKAMEGRSYRMLARDDGQYQLPAELKTYVDLFEQLQLCHDEWVAPTKLAYSFDTIVNNLRTIALRFGLTFNDPRLANG